MGRFLCMVYSEFNFYCRTHHRTRNIALLGTRGITSLQLQLKTDY